ncbi:hypothetical protein Ate02nite_69240 [Paractinoplanes tereljensis]|uniref:Uncharacterized protein n=1 Tax=Paractinoplanes tereljensis TaxID=571912 RepID=A0A919NUI5_9ACTN|nr:hypothetical protein Ate02nite_69240 [Actinoplanes tereljensis]
MRQVGVIDQPELFEQLEGAIDGGDVDPGDPLTDRGVHLLGRGVTEIMHRLQDELALRREPQPALTEHFG